MYLTSNGCVAIRFKRACSSRRRRDSAFKAIRRLMHTLIRSHLKNRILVQDQGGAEFQPADILKYFEDLKRGPNAEVGPKDIFEIASS